MLLAAVAALLALGSPAHATGNRVLHAQVGTQDQPDAFSISLTDSLGQPVRRLGAGSYDIEVDDWSTVHNFDLLQAGFSVFSTTVEETDHSTTTVALGAGSSTFRCDAHPTTMKGSFTVVSALADDGSGTITPSVSAVSAGSSGKTLSFTYTAAPGGLGGGQVTLAVPDGWSAPSTTGSAAGYVTSSAGSVAVSGQTITVSGLNLAGGDVLTLTYGSRAQSGPGATVSSSTGTQAWTAQERSTSDGIVTALSSQPQVSVVSVDGSGTLSPSTSSVSAGASAKTVSFTYTAAAGGVSGGSLTLAVPSGWSAPSTMGTAAGFVTASGGTVSVLGQAVTVSGLNLGGGATTTVIYGDKSQGGPGVTASSSTGTQSWSAQEASTAGGTLTALAASPQVTVYAADGSGTAATPTTVVSAQQTNNTVSFTYTAATGGIAAGAVRLVVPSGWSAPSTSPLNTGYTTASTGTLSISSRTILISSLTLATGAHVTVTYGSKAGGGPGAKAPSTVGIQNWAGAERSTTSGAFVALLSPHITVLAPDGSGTMTTPTVGVAHSATQQTLVFTYTGAAGGTSKGTVTLAVPTGWSAPSLTHTASGYATASRGAISISGRSIVVSGLNLAAGAKFTIAYGSKAAGGPGATAPATTGAQAWTSRERSWTGGVLHVLAVSPSITIT